MRPPRDARNVRYLARMDAEGVHDISLHFDDVAIGNHPDTL